MSSLPPYSTFRTDNKQMMYPQAISHGNILTFTPPGFTQSLNVKFPDSRLAVCDKCKKNYKTRDMCRVRNAHTDPPWTTAYMCMTLDDSCTDDQGKYIDKPLTVRMMQWQPYCIKTAFDTKTPVCSACKKTNRTRSFCRERHKHKNLPWCTVYVLLSALDTADPATVVAEPSKPVEADDGNKEEGTKDETDAKPKAEEQAEAPSENPTSEDAKDGGDADAEKKKEEDSAKAVSWEGDDINDIAESRTFLAKISCNGKSIHWLDLAEYDAGAPVVDPTALHYAAQAGGAPTDGRAVENPTYYTQTMGYATPQNTLKSQQQYFYQMQQSQQRQYAAQQAAWQAQYNHGQAPPGQPVAAPAQGAPAAVTAGEAAAQQQKQYQDAHSQWQGQPYPPQQLYQQQMAHFQQSGGIVPGQEPHAQYHPAAAVAPPAGDEMGAKLDAMDPANYGMPAQQTEENEAKRARLV